MLLRQLGRAERVWLRFVDGRPVSAITEEFLAWCCTRLQEAGVRVWPLIWDNASWHVSKRVRAWIRAHNRQVKQQGQGVRIVSCYLPVKSPWLNPIEPKWVHGKRAIVEPTRLLSAHEIAERVCAHFGCSHEPTLLFPTLRPDYALVMKHDTDWLHWHAPYHDPNSPLSRRLAIVQAQLRRLLPAVLDAPLQIASICAGQGNDLLGVLADYPHADQVRARLVELDESNVQAAQQRVRELRLSNVEVRLSDAALLRAYDGAVPADIVLACGVFGNISDADVFHTINLLPQLCRPGATVIWTRSRRVPDLTPAIRQYFAAHGFAETDFVAPDDVLFSVGVHQFMGEPEPLEPERRMFTFMVSER